jgi:hypothetical protein
VQNLLCTPLFLSVLTQILELTFQFCLKIKTRFFKQHCTSFVIYKLQTMLKIMQFQHTNMKYVENIVYDAPQTSQLHWSTGLSTQI